MLYIIIDFRANILISNNIRVLENISFYLAIYKTSINNYNVKINVITISILIQNL